MEDKVICINMSLINDSDFIRLMFSYRRTDFCVITRNIIKCFDIGKPKSECRESFFTSDERYEACRNERFYQGAYSVDGIYLGSVNPFNKDILLDLLNGPLKKENVFSPQKAVVQHYLDELKVEIEFPKEIREFIRPLSDFEKAERRKCLFIGGAK